MAGQATEQVVSKRILYVEDEPDAAEVMLRLLGSLGYQVTAAYTWAQALLLAQGECFDLYLLDYRIPQLDGLEVCRELRRFDPHTPIVFYSAVLNPQDEPQALATGAQALVAKTELDELQRTIARLLQPGTF